MMYLLDTNIIIYLMKNHPASVTARIAQLPAATRLAMSFITYGELHKGAQGSQNMAVALAAIERMTQHITVHYPDATTCHHYGIWANRLKRQGTPIGSNDLWIACHALSLGAVLVTHNVREYRRIETLTIEDWAEA